MCRLLRLGIHLIAVKAQVLRLVERDLLASHYLQPVPRPYLIQHWLDPFERNRIRRLARQPEQNSAIGPVAFASQCKRSVEVDRNPRDLFDQVLRFELSNKSERCAHRPDRV